MGFLRKIEKALEFELEHKRKRRTSAKRRAKKRRTEPRKKNGEFKKRR